MKKNGILNSEIAKILADLGHTDQLTIGDCGLPIPHQVPKIDLALELGTPSFIDVLRVVVKEMVIEKIILAEEIKEQNLEQLTAIHSLLGENIDIEYMSHEAFKHCTVESKAVIRTGEATPFSNVILQSGVIF